MPDLDLVRIWPCVPHPDQHCICTAWENEERDSPRERAFRGDLSDCWHHRDVIQQQMYYEAAAYDDPDGLTCGWCKGPNTFCDDIGWFVITPYGDDRRYCCEDCYRGPLGEAHIRRYGVGDR